MRLNAYESSISYKERMKRWHDKRIKVPINYEKGDKEDMKNEAIEMYDEEGSKFIVNKQRVKPYQNNVLDTNRDDDITLDDEGENVETALRFTRDAVTTTPVTGPYNPDGVKRPDVIFDKKNLGSS
uniref:Uncharacterized protein n=1 Tax=Tanacetum cinerariifolium TaxID=118510 RepID=A0A699JA11_TANCI|nr:hypothetical protein [Tanacetum cinerariifolium]